MNHRALPVLIVVLAATASGAAFAQDGGWVARRLPWYGLPGRALVDTAPVSLPMPAAPGACGAITDRIEPFAARGPVFLRMTLRVESGAVSISLRRPDGTTVLSSERTLTPAKGSTPVFIRVEPGDGPRAIALCQASTPGEDSRVEVQSVSGAFAERLPADEAARANQAPL